MRHGIFPLAAGEALTQVRRERRTSNDELWRQASQLRMANVMRPYLESIV